MQFSLEPIPALKDVPFILDMARDPEERALLTLLMQNKALGRPYFLAPKVPTERIAALRTAFDATMKNADFRADARKTVGPIDPVSGAQMQAVLAEVYALPPEMIERARKTVGMAGK